MSDDKEVRVKLVFDSNAKEASEDAKKTIEKNKPEMKEGMFNLKKSITAEAVGGALKDAFEKGLEFAKEAIIAPFEAFTESENQVRALAATLSMVGDQSQSLDQIHDSAAGTKDELEALAMQAGVTDDAMVGVFTNIIEHGGKSIDQAEKLTEQMAYAGRAIPGGAQALSSAFEGFELGVIRARNPLVQMISATGLLKGNAKQVAAELQKMSVEKQMAMAEKAVGLMADKMKKVPQTIEQMSTSLKVFGGNLLETAGEPMVKAATAVMAKIRNAFFTDDGPTAFAESLIAKAKMFGDFMGKVFEVGGDFVDGFGSGLADFGEELKVVWGEVFGQGDSSFASWKEFMHDAGHFIGEAITIGVTAFGGIIVIVQTAMKYLEMGIGMAVRSIGEALSNDAMTTSGNDLVKHSVKSEMGDQVGAAGKVGGGPAADIRAQYIANAQAYGASAIDAGNIIDAALEQRKITEHNVAEAYKDTTSGNSADFAMAFNNAAAIHDQGAMNQIAAMMRSSSTLKDFMTETGPGMFKEGTDSFIASLRATGQGAFADLLAAKGKTASAVAPREPKAPVFTGAISIKQEFKDMDPDRVVVAFQEKLGAAASSRIYARGGMAMGT